MFSFYRPSHCVVGRATDCDVRLPNESRHLDVSRYHCALEIDPPGLCVRDLGSLNGTFVNGRLIGKRLHATFGDDLESMGSQAVALQDGDQVVVGHAVLRVAVRSEEHAESQAEESASAVLEYAT
jgi:pSer/pThr/pTyr-binding forkhead associated (FHA) protein